MWLCIVDRLADTSAHHFKARLKSAILSNLWCLPPLLAQCFPVAAQRETYNPTDYLAEQASSPNAEFMLTTANHRCNSQYRP